MVAQPRTQKLYAGEVPAGAITTLATVPAGSRWLVKYANIIHTDSTPRYMSIYSTTTDGPSILLVDAALPGFQMLEVVEAYFVLDAGDTLVVATGASSSPQVFVHVGGLIFEL